MVCDKCEKKLGTVITPDTWKDGARNTTGLILMEKTSLQYVGYVRVLSISQGPTIVKDVPIKKSSKEIFGRSYFAYECQSEFEVNLKLTESLYLKIDPCLDNEILVTIIAVLP
ncbi:CXXC repeat containing interactor of PDZ3 [Turdus rufiventris]|nr:CXXC repeat containing interactor of PDZ3 [Turdus rufiventris]